MALVEAGHDVDAREGVAGQTPLHVALAHGNRQGICKYSFAPPLNIHYPLLF